MAGKAEETRERLGIDEGDQDVAGAGGRGQTLVQVGQAAGEHHRVADLVGRHSAIIADVADAAALVVPALLVQGHVYTVGAGVVVGPEGGLLVRLVADDEHHVGGDRLERAIN